MTAPMTSEREARAARRRRLQQRQTLIFGGLIGFLLVLALVAAAIWSGLLPSPVSRDFSREEDPVSSVTVPCPPEGATALEMGTVTANVYNGTDTPGLAGATAENLSVAGVLINQEANWPQGAFGGSVRIYAGPLGVRAAYTIARAFPEAEVALETGRTDETVDVVLGSEFDEMLPAEEVTALDPDESLSAPEGCEPIDVPEEGDGEGGAQE